LASKLVIVDAYPFLSAVFQPNITAQDAKSNAVMAKQYMSAQTQAAYESYVKSGVSTRMMVTRDTDLERIVAWGLTTDRTAAADAMVEMMVTDLRDDIAAIKSPTIVFGTWAGMKQYIDRAKTEASIKAQYAKLAGVEIHLHDTARHFLMWDDPDWMFGHMDRFLNTK